MLWIIIQNWPLKTQALCDTILQMTKKQPSNRARTYARNRSTSRRGYEKFSDPDTAYFLKLVIVLLLGTLWLRLAEPVTLGVFVLQAIPVGFIIALLLVSKLSYFRNDRKIWYAILLISTVIGVFLPTGFVL